jgi:hypothetical protein
MTLLEKVTKSQLQNNLQIKLNGHANAITMMNASSMPTNHSTTSSVAIKRQLQLQQKQQQMSANKSTASAATTKNNTNTNSNSTTTTTTTTTTNHTETTYTLKSVNRHSFMANRCCVCAKLLKNWRGHRLAKYYEISCSQVAAALSAKQQQQQTNGDSSKLGSNNKSTLVNKTTTTTTTTTTTRSTASRMCKQIAMHLLLDEDRKARSMLGYASALAEESGGARKLCASCYECIDQIDTHMRSVARLRSLMRVRMRKSVRLAVANTRPRTRATGRKPNKNGLVSDLTSVKQENSIPRVNYNNISNHLNANLKNGAVKIAIGSSTASSMSSSPSLSPAYNNNNNHNHHNGAGNTLLSQVSFFLAKFILVYVGFF